MLDDRYDISAQGTQAQPKFGSDHWFELRANALARGFLAEVERRGLSRDERACERFYRECLRYFKAADAAEEKPQ